MNQQEALEKISKNVEQIKVLLGEITTVADETGVDVDIDGLYHHLNTAEYAGGWAGSQSEDYDESAFSWNSSNC